MIKKIALLTCLLGMQQSSGLLNEQECSNLSAHVNNTVSTMNIPPIPKVSKLKATTTNLQIFNSAMKAKFRKDHFSAHNIMHKWKYYLFASIYNHIFTDKILQLYIQSVCIFSESTSLNTVEMKTIKFLCFLNDKMLNMVYNKISLQEFSAHLKETITNHFPEANLDHLNNWDNIRLYGTEHYIDLKDLGKDSHQKLKLPEEKLKILQNSIYSKIEDNLYTLREMFTEIGFNYSVINTHSAYDKHQNQFDYAENAKQADQYILPSDLISSDKSSQDKIAQCAYEEIFNEQISPEFYAAIAEKIISHLMKLLTMIKPNQPHDIIFSKHVEKIQRMLDIKFNIPTSRDDIEALYHDTIKRRAYIAQYIYLEQDVRCHGYYVIVKSLFLTNQSDEITKTCRIQEIIELFDPRNYIDMMLQGSFNMHLGLFLIKPNFI